MSRLALPIPQPLQHQSSKGVLTSLPWQQMPQSTLKTGVDHCNRQTELKTFFAAFHRCIIAESIDLPGLAKPAMELGGRHRKGSWGHRRARGGMKGKRAK